MSPPRSPWAHRRALWGRHRGSPVLLYCRSSTDVSQSPYGNLEWKPMSPRTKSKVQNTRRVQLLLRLCALLGALGMLFCVICIKNTTSTVGWVIRIPVGLSIVKVSKSNADIMSVLGRCCYFTHDLRCLSLGSIIYCTYPSNFSQLHALRCNH